MSAGRVSLSRLQSLLDQEEVLLSKRLKMSSPEIHLQNTSFIIGTNTTSKETELEDSDEASEVKMVKMEEEVVLSNITLQAKSGMLVGIVGRIGSGKSSLLNGILGEIPLQSGYMSIQGSIAYAAQQPWLLNNTLQENITFGTPFKQKRYQQILSICQLERDLELLPSGDQTEIGENGINLSGGQKARVSLARAVYSNANIYLLDDPLSAADQHVGRRLFDDCINGYLRDKLVLFVTNQLQYLSQCDVVILLKDKKMVASDNYKNLLQNPIFAEMMQNFGENTEQSDSNGTVKVGQAQDDKKSDQDGKLTEAEDRSSGKVPLSVYAQYLKGGGLLIAFLNILCFIAVASLNALSEWFLSYWIGSAQSGTHSVGWYIGTLAGIIFSFSFILLLRGVIFSHFTLASSTQMHNDVFARVMRAPMSFFDSTPLGRILNRLSQDQDKADVSLPERLVDFLHYSCWCLASVVVIIVNIPWFAAAVVPALVFFQYLTNYFVMSSRELKRLEAISVSPLIAHISATITGLPTIRAYGVAERFKDEMERKIKTNMSNMSLLLVSNRWVAIRFDSIGALGVFMAIAICLVISKDIGSGLAGLVVSFALTLITNLQWAVRTYAETENDMTSYQRLLTYKTTLPQEAPKKGQPLHNWPSGGSIQFHNVKARYKDSLPAVLKSISFSISKGEKIGIVGRTGSGKSTITLLLFRIIEPYMGTICIDGIDITKIGLDDLRRALSIIPQDPVLFIGTLRSNLDPFLEHSDEELWEVLKKVHLIKFVKSLPLGLESEIQEKGNNLSLGQRQLVCIARALLRRTQILVLDEATASVDYETDHLIQETIKESFSHCTILTIAHRLHTIVHSDRILVLEGGQVLEFDSPKKLISDDDSQFSSLIRETDPQTQAFLKNAIHST
uniref:Uncharacterized protein n=1 Tax=Arcella intermedia TaxID=1963864 RepID=A0A6B2KXT9_9EUKA